MIFKRWWFELYSLPLLKKTFIFFLIALAADLLLMLAGDVPMLGLICFATPILPFFGIVFLRKPSLSLNLTFHKLHLPLKELHKDLLLNFLVDFLSTNVFLLLLFITSSFFEGNVFKSVLSLYRELGFYQLLFYYLGFAIFSLYLMIYERDLLKRKSTFMALNGGFFRNIGFFIYNFLIGIPVFLASIFVMGFEPEGMVLVFFCGGLGACIRELKSKFHKIPQALTYKIHFKHYLKGSAYALGIFLVCAVGARFDVFDSSLTPDQRAESFRFSGALKPKIDIETFRAIEPKLGFGSSLYSNVEFDPSILGVEYFLDKDSTHRLVEFLSYGSPSKEFLHNLYDDFESRPLWKDKKNQRTMHLAFLRWPRKEKFPEQFLVAREKLIEIRKQYASEMAEKRKRRNIASEEK